MAVQQEVTGAHEAQRQGGGGTGSIDDTRKWAGLRPLRTAGFARPLRLHRDGRLWVVVLAGGEGRRLLDCTRGPDGVAVPKQFYRFRDRRTLLRVTLDRSFRLVPPEQVVCVMLEEHRSWWEHDLADVPPANVLAQPAGRGTAVAILQAVEHIRRLDGDARILLLPSDHDVDEEGVLLTALGSAARSGACFPDDVLLLGAVPDHVDTGYGLVLPNPRDRAPIPRVRAFVEKPAAALGANLVRRGARWNTFMFTCTPRVLLDLYARALPALLEIHRRAAGQVRAGGLSLRGMFARLPEHDFSRDVLQRSSARLRLATVPECGWTDLGTPARLAAWLERHRDARYFAEHPASGPADPPA